MPRLIDADALMAQLKAIRIRSNDLTIDYKRGHSDGIITAVEYADDAPTADVAPVVRGEWKRGREFSSYPRVPFIGDAYYCSNCEEEAYWDTDYGQQLFGFCPNCGAKMEGKP